MVMMMKFLGRFQRGTHMVSTRDVPIPKFQPIPIAIPIPELRCQPIPIPEI